MHPTEGGNRSLNNSNFHFTKDINALSERNPYNHADLYVNTSYALLNHMIYFGADDGIHGNELRRSDGTVAGTYMVKYIESGSRLFSAFNSSYGWEPWVSDGQKAAHNYSKI